MKEKEKIDEIKGKLYECFGKLDDVLNIEDTMNEPIEYLYNSREYIRMAINCIQNEQKKTKN